jgi:hypothetical protein
MKLPAELKMISELDRLEKENSVLRGVIANAAISYDEFRVAESDGKPCHYCGEPVNALAGNPGLWPIVMSHSDEPGVPKIHHMSCVQVRLDEWKLKGAPCALYIMHR